MGLEYLHYDVFTDVALTGNQLAVFLDARGLPPPQMQAIAREMNFSESTFILPAEAPGTDVRMRIFTPGQELPMAGHPTIGSAFALAQAGVISAGTSRFVFGLGVGPIPVDLEWEGGRLSFVWMTQLPPVFARPVEYRAAVAGALGLQSEDLHEGLPIQEVSCGVPFLLVPLRDGAAVDRAGTDRSAIGRLREDAGIELPMLLFALDPPVSAYCRMFAPQFGVAEDPATGSAAGPLGCYLVQHGLVTGPDQQRVVIVQGVAMARPSRIHVAIDGAPHAITAVRVGGRAVLVARGELLV